MTYHFDSLDDLKRWLEKQCDDCEKQMRHATLQRDKTFYRGKAAGILESIHYLAFYIQDQEQQS